MNGLKLTPKQDKFCMVFIETGNASEAYRQAYDVDNMKDTTINRSSIELLNTRKITARLDEIRGIHAERHEITVDKLCNMYMASYQLALAKDNPSAAVTATTGLGKLYGLITDRGIIEHNGLITHEHSGLSAFDGWLAEWGSDPKGEQPSMVKPDRPLLSN